MKKIIIGSAITGLVILAGCAGPQYQPIQPVQIPPSLTNLVDQIIIDATPVLRDAVSNRLYHAVNK